MAKNKLRGQSFVTIMIVIAVTALILRILIEQVVKMNISQNESNAQSTLKLLSAALENYAKDHLGAYPEDLVVLSETTPPYLDKNYNIDLPVKGYIFSCARIEASGYSCSATPLKCNVSGQRNYGITTGGIFMSEDCKKRSDDK